MTGATGHPDAEWRLDRSIEQPIGSRVAAAVLAGHEFAVTLPARERAVQLAPLLRIKARVGKFPQPKGARGRAEPQVAGVLALIDAAVRRRSVERGVLEIARRVPITLLADRREKSLVAGAILESVRLIERSRWTVG